MMKQKLIMLLAVAALAAAGPYYAGTLAGTMDRAGPGMPSEYNEQLQGMNEKPKGEPKSDQAHQAMGTVQSVDAAKGSVKISHGPVKSLNWPAMTMTFAVKDKSLLKQLAEGKKVQVEFVKDGSDYTIVRVK